MSGRSMQSVVHSPGSPETQRRQVEQRVLWEKYCEWLELIRDFAELESNQSHTSTADLAGCISFADYSRLDSPSESLIAESVGTAVHNAQCEKHVSEFPRIVLSQRPVSFGNQSVASFNSNDSPIVLSDNLLSGSGYANSCSSTAVIADSELFPLPPEAAGLVRCMPTESVMELLRMSPSNDYINAVLAYNCATPATLWRRPASSTCSSEATYMQSTTYNVLPRSTSALSTQTPEQFARYSAPPILSSAVVPTLPMHIRAAWESDLRMRLLPTDWTKLVEELLQNNCGSVFASAALQEHNRHISTTERTHYESKVYWDIVWRTLPLGCQRGDETCARCGNLVETFVHFLWTCPVAARLWRRLERVIGALAASVLEAQRIDIPARQSFESARSAGGSSVRDYGVRADGRIRITLVDVLFCFPRIRSGGGGRGFQRNNSAQLSEKFCKTLNLLHATALVSLFEARAYHSEGEDIGWSLFVTRYQARRDVHIERRDIV
ncbi:hypothetical protein HDU83_007304 [Entophlyctis luteolus]|nr:hypothetical protein HDU83_007304 [Entophlyctis luteolus]